MDPVIDDIPIDDVPRDDDYDDYDDGMYETPQGRPTFDGTSTSSGGVEMSTPKRPKTAEELRQELVCTKLSDLYKYLNIRGKIDFNEIDLNRFRLERNTKLGTILEFDKDGDRKKWVNLTDKRTGKFLAHNSLRDKFGGLNARKAILSVDKIPELDKTIDAAVKLLKEIPTGREIENIPLQDLPTLANDVHVLTKEASQNTDLDMREFLGIDAALQKD